MLEFRELHVVTTKEANLTAKASRTRSVPALHDGARHDMFYLSAMQLEQFCCWAIKEGEICNSILVTVLRVCSVYSRLSKLFVACIMVRVGQ